MRQPDDSELVTPDLLSAQLISSSSPKQAGLLGIAILLLANPTPSNRWIRRRVDSLTFLDQKTILRKVSIDLDLDLFALKAAATTGQWPTLHDHLLLPLAMLPKAPRRPIHVEDESGGAVPRLTKLERLPLMSAGFVRYARSLLDQLNYKYADSGIQSISTLVEKVLDTEPTHAARAKAKEDLRRLRNAHGAARDPAVGRILAEDIFWYPLMDLVDHYYLVVPIPLSCATRRVLSYHYLDYARPVTRKEGVRSAVSGLLSAPEFRFEIEAPAVGDSDTFHLEVEAPYDLRVSDVSMTIDFARKDSDPKVFVDDDRHSARAHVFCAISEPVKEAKAAGVLRPLETGMIRSAAIASAFVALVLVAGSAGLVLGLFDTQADGRSRPIDPSSATALLLVVPGIFATYLSQASRHGLTSKVNFRLRAILGVSSLCSFAAGASVATKLKTPAFERVWYSAATLSVIVTAILLTKCLTNLAEIRSFRSVRA